MYCLIRPDVADMPVSPLKTASILLMAVVLAACSNDTDPGKASAPKPSPPATQAESTDVPVTGKTGSTQALAAGLVMVENDRLSVRIDDYPLSDALDTISKQTGIDIVYLGGFSETRINHEFSDLSLEQGLRQLLKGTESVFVYADSDSGSTTARSVKQVFLLPKGENATADKKAPVEAATNSPSPMSRETSLQVVRQHAYDSGDTLTVQILDAVIKNQNEAGQEASIHEINNKLVMDEIAKAMEKQAQKKGAPPDTPQ